MRLIDVQPFKYSIVEKQKRPGVLMTLEGVVQRADTQNANRRVYPTSLWNKILSSEDTNERIANRRMLGELDHPASGSTSLTRVSHVVTEHKLLPNGEVRGSIDVLDTPSGRIAASLFEAGVQLGVSSRGDGSIEQKGDTNEVQDDFTLETYDLVLKPSTPGAYPQVVESEEAAQKNPSLIADAVEGLVNGTSEIDVLLECHKIISVLEGCDSRCDSVIKLLKEKLSQNNTNESDNSSKNDKHSSAQHEQERDDQMEEHNMSAKDQIPQLSPEVTAFLKEQVDRGIREAVEEKDEQISGLNERIVELTAKNEDTEEQLQAAKDLLSEATKMLKEATEDQEADSELTEKYEAACKIIYEAIPRIKEAGNMQRQLQAAKDLLSASLNRHQQESVQKAVNSLLKGVNEKVSEKFRPLLESCSNASEVKTKFAELTSLVESLGGARPPSKEPLPVRSGTLTEDQHRKQHVVESSDPVTNYLLQRVSGVSPR